MYAQHPSRRRRDLVLYGILSFGFSWLVGIPLALANQGVIEPLLPEWTHYLYGYGPMLAALLVSGINLGPAGLRELGSRMVRWRVRPIWWAVALSPLAAGLATALVLGQFAGGDYSLATIGQVKFLGSLGVGALPLWVLTFGIGEETGWRGFALPRLQFGRSALSATAILWLFWALWHIPAFFYVYDPAILPGFLVGQFAGALLFTWLFNSADGSVLIVAVWHGCFNFISSSQAGDGLLAAVVSTLVMILAAIVLIAFKPRNLSRKHKQAI